ncbi:MAG TPA: hypothetical protein O0X39_04245 [Methanocorpusculum sp.]|nr:hypothetical protein [Methanocorpusculum sp.]
MYNLRFPSDVENMLLELGYYKFKFPHQRRGELVCRDFAKWAIKRSKSSLTDLFDLFYAVATESANIVRGFWYPLRGDAYGCHNYEITARAAPGLMLNLVPVRPSGCVYIRLDEVN